MVATTPDTSAGRAWPVAGWLRRYRWNRLGPDSLGAATAWALIVPEGVAYAQIAGVPPQNAFYAAPVALLAYALFGTSRFLVVGATSAAAVLSGATVSGLTGDPAQAAAFSAALALMAGTALAVAGLCRLGFIADFLAEPTLVGFLFGMALTMIVRQLSKLTGQSTGDGDFFQRLWHVLAHIDLWSWTTVAVGAAAIAALLLLERFLPKVPAALVVLVAGIMVSAAAGLKDHGVDIVGRIPRALPTPAWPDVPLHDWLTMLSGAMGVALICFAEGFSIAGSFARKHGDKVDASREMTAMGAANAAVGLFRGFVVSGSASRSAAAEGAGGSSPMVSAVAAVLVLVTGAFLTPLFTDLPEPVLGAIVVVAVRGFLDVGAMRRYWNRDRPSFAVAATALLGVLVFDLLPGLLLAVLLSLALFIAAASRPELSVLGRVPGTTVYADAEAHAAETFDGLLLVRPDGTLFFGNAARVRNEIGALAAERRPRVAVLDLTASYRFGVQVLDTLGELREELARTGTDLWLARPRRWTRAFIESSSLGARLGPDRIFDTVHDAVTAYAASGAVDAYERS
ncbi:SulP family inorganic anion transporter [Streptomyces sp. NPDC020917]|uniref:SulP family inorganic anion transporter n=1 Tax=Streptomyces sp. NPDC020917 TaxID=3365102 RepID=UPI00378FEE09